jgi:RNA-binding protein
MSGRRKKEQNESPPPPPVLEGFQRKYLRGLVHGQHALVQVGHQGISNAVIDAIDDALLDHELIKVRMHEPEDKKAMAAELAQRAGAALCGLIGHQAILYRRHPKRPRIRLPQR